MRSKNVYRPYEVKQVLAQGTTGVNGPHQGGLVDTQTGEWWFMHFQDKGAYGRILHLQPVTWKNGFPVMGINDKDYCGEPVLSYKKPDVGNTFLIETPQESDEFNSDKLGLQWQWLANPQQAWAFPSANGYLRMYGQYYPDRYVNMWNIPNLLLQKIPAPTFTATVKLSAALLNDGDKAGFIVMGRDYSYLSLERQNGKYLLKQMVCNDAEQNNAEKSVWQTEVSKIKINEKFNYKTPVPEAVIYFRLKVRDGGICSFSYSTDGKNYDGLPQTFKAREGKWTGAKMGLFILNQAAGTSRSWMDADWFKVEK